MKISVVMPVHNEEEYLRYSLPVFRVLKDIDEFVFVLDRCIDDSEKLVRTVFPEAKIYIKTDSKWRNKCAESFQYGFNRATGDIIWAVGADIIPDLQIPQIIKEEFSKDPMLGTLCFRYYDYDIFSFKRRIHGFYNNLYKNLVQHIRKEARHTGFYAFRKQMMLEIGGLEDLPSEYDWFARKVKASKWHYKYIPYTKTLHLRPGLSRFKQYNQGKARFHLPQYNLLKTILHSFVHFKPYLIVGYLHERARSRMRSP